VAGSGVADPPFFDVFPNGDAFLPGSRSDGSDGVSQSTVRQILCEPPLVVVRGVRGDGGCQYPDLAKKRTLAPAGSLGFLSSEIDSNSGRTGVYPPMFLKECASLVYLRGCKRPENECVQPIEKEGFD
jgi:hypothetical protein